MVWRSKCWEMLLLRFVAAEPAWSFVLTCKVSKMQCYLGMNTMCKELLLQVTTNLYQFWVTT